MVQPTLHVHQEYWALRIDECPCDIEFVQWLDAHGVTDAAIYHFGTGGHHTVGIACADPRRRNAVLGITLMPEEHQEYLKLVIARPDVMRHYNVIFGDIYLANEKLLPDFDVVTLFHLCEYRSAEHDAYGALSDLDVAGLLTRRVRRGGHVLFYTGSFAFDATWDLIAQWERAGDVERVGGFKTLLVYRKL